MMPPDPPPDTTVVIGNAPSMTWFFNPETNLISSIIVIYNIQVDSLVKTLDDTLISVDIAGIIALFLGFFSLVITYYQEKKNKKLKQEEDKLKTELREMLKRHDDRITELKEMLRAELNHDDQ
jgi:hypothetical protein